MAADYTPITIDFTKKLLEDTTNLAWYNAFARGADKVFQGNHAQRRRYRENCKTLHGYQNFANGIVCAVASSPSASDKFVYVSCGEGVTIEFRIEGGAEIPHFTLSMRLTPQGLEGGEELLIKVIWTAWGTRGFDTHRARNRPFEDPAIDSYTFSSRLQNVKVEPIQLSPQQAAACNGTPGNGGYLINWSHYHHPYCVGVDIPVNVLTTLTNVQRQALQGFYLLGNGERDVKIMTRARATLMDNWRFLPAIPSPTPPPYPLYSCKYVVDQGLFASVSEIPSFQDGLIQQHHRIREPRWTNNPPNFAQTPSIASMHDATNPIFINERHYKVIKTVGLLREVDAQRGAYCAALNKHYSFRLWPLSMVHGLLEASLDEYFYGVIDITPAITRRDSPLEQTFPTLEPGTPVTVTTKQGDVPGKETSKSTPDKWTGVVVSTPKGLESAGLPSNSLCVRLKRPSKNIRSTGNIMDLSGWAEFGSQNPAFVQTRSAIRNAMYGNKGLAIPENNKLKTLLLGHNNSTLKLHAQEGALSLAARDYVQSLHTSCNEQQIAAIESALCIGSSFRSFLALITGGPGTGKTTVTSRIAEYCRLHNEAILIACGSNAGLDVVAQRISNLLKDPSSSVDVTELYRLDTEFGEETDMQLTPDTMSQPTGTDERFKRVKEELLRMGADITVPDTSQAIIEGLIRRKNPLSLGQHIVSRLKKAVKEGSHWPVPTPDDREEMALL